jgi:hypothetical protein
MPRTNARKDANHDDIVRFLRDVGATVQTLHQVGNGAPDLLVGWRGVNLALEVKDGSKPPSKRKLTPDEEQWHATWSGQIAIVESTDDVWKLLNETGTR